MSTEDAWERFLSSKSARDAEWWCQFMADDEDRDAEVLDLSDRERIERARMMRRLVALEHEATGASAN